MAYIEVIGQDEAQGELAAIYEKIAGSRGKLAEVHTIQSLNPPTIPAHMELYRTVMFTASPLSRAEREIVAVVVSAANRCAYCVAHHVEALDHFWRDRARCERLAEAAGAGSSRQFSSEEVALSHREQALCTFGVRVTEDPGSGEDGSAVRDLRSALPGVTDREILDTTLVVGYFNFVNRIVLTLGVEVEQEPGGYRYD